MPGYAHRERGVGEVQRGLGSSKLDSHRLVSSKSAFKIPPEHTTLGIELRLPPARETGLFACVSGMTRSEPRVSYVCSQQSVPHDWLLELFLPPDTSWIVRLDVLIAKPLGSDQPILEPWGVTGRTMYVAKAGGTPRVDPDQVMFGRASTRLGVWVPSGGSVGGRGEGILRECAPSPAQIGKWIGGLRALGIVGLRIKRPPLVVPVGPHAGETTVNFIVGTFRTKLSMRISGGRHHAITCPYVANGIFRLKHIFPMVSMLGILFCNSSICQCIFPGFQPRFSAGPTSGSH